MRGIERLRELARGIGGWVSLWSVTSEEYDEKHGLSMMGKGGGLSNVLSDIAGQIAREHAEDCHRMGLDYGTVALVIAGMERHVSGHEGAEDSPVARWARELRDALKSYTSDAAEDVSMSAYDLLQADEREAIAWVREHGGLSHVKDIYHDFRAVVECLGIEWSESELHGLMDALRAAIEETCTRLGVEHTGDLTQDAQAIWREVSRLKSLLGDSVPRASYERHLARLQRQIDESHAALRRRNARVAELETERDKLRRQRSEAVSAQLASDAALYDLRRELRDLCEANGVEPGEDPLRAMGRHAENLTAVVENLRLLLNARAMPEGLSWPRWDDDRPLTYDDAPGDAIGVFLALDGSCWATMAYVPDGCHEADERVKRPAKVLDADGAEIRVGDTVYALPGEWCNRYPCFGMYAFREMTVSTLTNGRRDGSVTCESGNLTCYPQPSQLTHRAPVLAADGRPLREGETVWDKDGTELEVVAAKVLSDGPDRVNVVRRGEFVVHTVYADRLTHERPESKCRDCAHWQKDPTADNLGVCWFFYHEHEGQDCYAARRGDIGACEEFMPRAKALAERSTQSFVPWSERGQ